MSYTKIGFLSGLKYLSDEDKKKRLNEYQRIRSLKRYNNNANVRVKKKLSYYRRQYAEQLPAVLDILDNAELDDLEKLRQVVDVCMRYKTLRS